MFKDAYNCNILRFHTLPPNFCHFLSQAYLDQCIATFSTFSLLRSVLSPPYFQIIITKFVTFYTPMVSTLLPIVSYLWAQVQHKGTDVIY